MRAPLLLLALAALPAMAQTEASPSVAALRALAAPPPVQQSAPPEPELVTGWQALAACLAGMAAVRLTAGPSAPEPHLPMASLP